MIMAKEQAVLKAQEQLAELEQLVAKSAAEGRRIDLVERDLFAGLLHLGHSLLSSFVSAQGDGDAGPTLTCEGKTLRRQEQPQSRRYVSIFGELSIERRVYAQRSKQQKQAPLDARLGLPAGDFSYVLEDWLERLCVREAFAEACRSLADLLGVKLSVRAAEQMSQGMAQHVERFQAQQPPPPAEKGEILVATFDGKGVPMRRPLEQRVRSGPRRRKGEKANKKQMACVAGVYSIDRFRRTADDVLDEVCRRERRQDRPQPQHKRVWAELTHVHEGELINGRSLAFVGAAVELLHRDPHNRKTIVCVTDGEEALFDEVRQWLPPRTIHILDIMHVLERLWQAAYCFHAEGSRDAEAFVEHRLRMLLEGKVGHVIGGLRRMLTRHGLLGEKRRTLQGVIRYYENHRDSMRYDQYLAAGYPIGSGVVEGACRHLVKDRMERTGMRWTVPGARAILHLRSVYLNEDWQDFVNYRIEAAQTALYGQRAA